MTEEPGQKSRPRALWRFGADLGPRILSALVLVPVAILALVAGYIPFALLIGAVMVGAYREWEVMVGGAARPWPVIFLMGLVALAALSYPMSGAWAVSAIFAIAIGVAVANGGPHWRWRVLGLCYFCLTTIAFLAIRGSSAAGIWAGVFLVTVTWLTDTGAYFAGRIIGGVKLSPDVSPSKTWSGALGGLACGTAGGLVVWLLAGWALDAQSTLAIGLLIAVVVSIAAQGGDLAESAVKRRFLVKDSGDIIPGHGGLLDRIDSLMMAGLVLWIIGLIHRGAGAVPQGILIW